MPLGCPKYASCIKPISPTGHVKVRTVDAEVTTAAAIADPSLPMLLPVEAIFPASLLSEQTASPSPKFPSVGIASGVEEGRTAIDRCGGIPTGRREGESRRWNREEAGRLRRP